VASLVTPLSWQMAFMLGAVLASTDPVAVTALGRRLALALALALAPRVQVLVRVRRADLPPSVTPHGGGCNAPSIWRRHGWRTSEAGLLALVAGFLPHESQET